MQGMDIVTVNVQASKTDLYMSVRACMRVCVHMCMSVCVYACILSYICMLYVLCDDVSMGVCVCVHRHAYSHVCT